MRIPDDQLSDLEYQVEWQTLASLNYGQKNPQRFGVKVDIFYSDNGDEVWEIFVTDYEAFKTNPEAAEFEYSRRHPSPADGPQYQAVRKDDLKKAAVLWGEAPVALRRVKILDAEKNSLKAEYARQVQRIEQERDLLLYKAFIPIAQSLVWEFEDFSSGKVRLSAESWTADSDQDDQINHLHDVFKFGYHDSQMMGEVSLRVDDGTVSLSLPEEELEKIKLRIVTNNMDKRLERAQNQFDRSKQSLEKLLELKGKYDASLVSGNADRNAGGE